MGVRRRRRRYSHKEEDGGRPRIEFLCRFPAQWNSRCQFEKLDSWFEAEREGNRKRSPAASASTATAAPNKAKMSPKPTPAALPKPKLSINVKPNQPVPLHIAISRVKESFPLRRAVKGLQSWEAGCARFFKDMIRHPWISAARPKFIFHVPVPVLFPVSNVPAQE